MKFKHIIYSLVAGMGLSACADMDYHEYKVLDDTDITETFSYIYGFMTYIYRDLDYDFGQNYSGASLCSATDEAVYSHQGNQIESFYNGSWSPTNANSAVWNNCWDAIAYCNLMLNRFNDLTFSDYQLDVDYKAEMEKYENFQWECRFMRAYFYFQLVRQYGGVPLITEYLDADEANNLPRNTAQEIFDFIDSECAIVGDSIIENYSTAYTSIGSEPNRANKLAVYALRARAALYNASPLFNENSDPEMWGKAALAANNAIRACKAWTGGTKSLATDYSSMFKSDNYTNSAALKEIIFMRLIDASNSFEKYNFPIGMENAGGGNCPTENLVSAYEFTDGTEFSTSNPLYNPENPYENRDSRLALTVARNDERWPDDLHTDVLQIYYGGSSSRSTTYGTPTGYYLKKYVNQSTVIGASSATSAYHNWVIFRLGELYLDYAEAMLNYAGDGYTTKDYGGTTFTMTAAEAINMIRARAGQPDIATGLSFSDFWNKYQNERFVELAFEGHRFYDVRRWMKGAEYFKNIDVMEVTMNADNTFSYKTVTNPSYITSRQWDDSKMNLSPIPQSEIMKSGSLTQNPGW